MKPTLQTVAADIARRIPAMKTDSSLNNEQLIAGMIEPLLEQHDEEAESAKECIGGILCGLLICAVIMIVATIVLVYG